MDLIEKITVKGTDDLFCFSFPVYSDSTPKPQNGMQGIL